MGSFPLPPRRIEVDPRLVVPAQHRIPLRPAPRGPSRSIPVVTPPPVGPAPIPRSDPTPFRRFVSR